MPVPSIEALRELAEAHLGPPLWLTLEHLAWLRDANVAPAPISACFADAFYKVPVEPLTRRFTASLLVECAGDVSYRVVAALAPGLPSAAIAMFLTDEATLLFLVQNDASRKGGIIQLHAGDAGITALTPEKLRAQSGQPLLKGDGVRAVHRQARDEGSDEWRDVPPSPVAP